MLRLPQGPRHSVQGDQDDQPQFTEGGPRVRAAAGLGAPPAGLGGDQRPLRKGRGGLTGTVWVGPAAPGPSISADAEPAVGLDALPTPVVGAVHQAGALPRPHTPPLVTQHLPCGVPAA